MEVQKYPFSVNGLMCLLNFAEQVDKLCLSYDFEVVKFVET